jgi:hypothetical protein
MAVTLYFSGFESSWPDLVKLEESTLEHKPKAVMMSYMHMQGKSTAWQQLKEFRSKYGGKVMIDSGAFSFLNNDVAEQGKANASSRDIRTSEGAREWTGKEDEYVHNYMKWAEENRDAYDWLVELDIQKLVGQEKVDAWREEWLAKGLPIVFVMHSNAGDTIETARKWKEKGCKYFGLGSGWTKDNAGDRLFLQQLSECGFVHMFAFTPADLFSYGKWITSVDSTSWLQAGKQASLFIAKGKKLSGHEDLRHKPIILHQIMKEPVMQLFTQEERERAVKEHRYRILNFYNLIELQKWVDNNNEEPGYKTAVDLANAGGTPLPMWAGDTDRLGRSKVIYAKSRFNALKSGMYARELQKSALECNNCIVNDKCPVFEKDALCFFIPTWRKMGGSTRNQEQITRKMEDLIADKFVRYQRASYMEARLGGATDSAVSQFENDLLKAMELLYRVKYGMPGAGMKVALNMTKDGVQVGMALNTEQILADVQAEYGDRLVEKIRKRAKAVDIEAKEVTDGGEPSRGTEEEAVKSDTV